LAADHRVSPVILIWDTPQDSSIAGYQHRGRTASAATAAGWTSWAAGRPPWHTRCRALPPARSTLFRSGGWIAWGMEPLCRE